MRKVVPLALTLLLQTTLSQAQLAAEPAHPMEAQAQSAPAQAKPSPEVPAQAADPTSPDAQPAAPGEEVAAPATPAGSEVPVAAPPATPAPVPDVPSPATATPEPLRATGPVWAPGHEALYLELARVSGDLEMLQAERAQHRVGGPIALMAAGLGVGLVTGLLAFSALETATRIDGIGTSRSYRDVRRYDLNNSGVVNWRDEQDARTVARTLGIASCLSLGVGIAGSVLFARRKAKRDEHKAEIAGLKQRKRTLMRAIRYDAHAIPGRLELGLSGSF